MLIVTEGAITEPQYLNRWYRDHKHRVHLTLHHRHTDPLSIVRDAKQLDRSLSQGKRSAFAAVWCVFDRDEHPEVPRAISEASDLGYHVAISNPCIELWFILHFQHQTAWIGRDDAQRASTTLLGAGKNLTADALLQLMERYPEARKHAQHLRDGHMSARSPWWENPSSNVWQLIDETFLASEP